MSLAGQIPCRANIATYATAAVFHDANREQQTLDVDAIWRRLSLSEMLQRALRLAVAEANEVIVHPLSGPRNMSGWAKQGVYWNGMMGRTLDYGDDFYSCLTRVCKARTAKRDDKAKQAITDGITTQTRTYRVQSDS